MKEVLTRQVIADAEALRNAGTPAARVKAIVERDNIGGDSKPTKPKPKKFLSKTDKHAMDTAEKDLKIIEQMALVELSPNEFNLALHYIVSGRTLRVALNKVKPHSAVQVSRRLMQIQDDPDLLVAYKRARNLQGTLLADDILDISNGDDMRMAMNEDSANNIARDGLKIKTRQWLAKVYNPEEFGNQLKVEIAEQENLQTLFNTSKIRQQKEASNEVLTQEVKVSTSRTPKEIPKKTEGAYSEELNKARVKSRLKNFMEVARDKSTKRREL